MSTINCLCKHFQDNGIISGPGHSLVLSTISNVNKSEKVLAVSNEVQHSTFSI